MNVIQNNPYRVLGVYASASIKEITASKSKIIAFDKVGRLATFPDIDILLIAPLRNEETVANAVSQLTLPHDKIKHSLFWFHNSSPLDKLALAEIKSANHDKAVEILSKKVTYSSLINKAVYYLVKKDYYNAITCYSSLIHNDALRELYISSVVGEICQLSEEQLSELLIDALTEEIRNINLLPYFTNPLDKAYLKNKLLSIPLAKIESEISISQKVGRELSDNRYRAGTSLMQNTKSALAELKNLSSTSEVQVRMVLDKLATEILQCGIDYFNKSNTKDAPRKSMILQNYALSIAVGQIAKDRCLENVEILQEIIKKLPPEAVYDEDKIIKEALAKYCKLPDKISYAVELLKTCRLPLSSIRFKLGQDNSFYLEESTLVVSNALHNLIEEVNSVNNDQLQMNLLLDREGTIRKFKNIVSQAWEATLIMNDFDMDAQFKSLRYIPNKNSLRNLYNSLGISNPPKPAVITYRSSSPPPKPVNSTYRPSPPPQKPTPSPVSTSDTNWGCWVIVIIVVFVFCLTQCH